MVENLIVSDQKMSIKKRQENEQEKTQPTQAYCQGKAEASGYSDYLTHPIFALVRPFKIFFISAS